MAAMVFRIASFLQIISACKTPKVLSTTPELLSKQGKLDSYLPFMCELRVQSGPQFEGLSLPRGDGEHASDSVGRHGLSYPVRSLAN